MPDWLRIQARTSLSSSVTKNMRSASERCAIEKIATRGLPASLSRRCPTSSGSPSHPGCEARRGEQVVERHRQLEAVLRRVRRIRGRARRLGRTAAAGSAAISAGMSSAWPVGPGRAEDAREQDVLAALDRVGVDAEQRQQARRDRADLIARPPRRPSGRRAARTSRARTGAARRRCRACRSRRRPRRAAAGCARRPGPSRRDPCVHSSACALARSRRARRRPCAASSSSIQGRKSSGRSSGNVSSRFARSPLGSMMIAGMPSIAASSSSAEAEARLAAAGHADAHRVRRQVLGVVEDEAVRQLLGLGVVRLAEVEAPQPFDSVHHALPALAGRASLGGWASRRALREGTLRGMAITSSASGVDRIESLLGEEAEDLLGHECNTIAKERLHLPGPDFVDRVVRDSDRPVPVLRSLQSIFSPRPAGRHGLPLDPARRPGHRALGGRVVRQEPGLLRSREHRQAGDRGRLQRGRLDARRARRGARASTRTGSRSSLKLNHNEFLTLPERLRPDHVRARSSRPPSMGAVAVGATIYFGSRGVASARSSRSPRPSQHAHELGMATILWCYLRNSAFNKTKDGGPTTTSPPT